MMFSVTRSEGKKKHMQGKKNNCKRKKTKNDKEKITEKGE